MCSLSIRRTILSSPIMVQQKLKELQYDIQYLGINSYVFCARGQDYAYTIFQLNLDILFFFHSALSQWTRKAFICWELNRYPVSTGRYWTPNIGECFRICIWNSFWGHKTKYLFRFSFRIETLRFITREKYSIRTDSS